MPEYYSIETSGEDDALDAHLRAQLNQDPPAFFEIKEAMRKRFNHEVFKAITSQTEYSRAESLDFWIFEVREGLTFVIHQPKLSKAMALADETEVMPLSPSMIEPEELAASA